MSIHHENLQAQGPVVRGARGASVDRGTLGPNGGVRRARRFIRGFLTNAALILAVLAGGHWWQTRNLLPAGSASEAPSFTLLDMDGTPHDLAATKGRKVLLYFMAPWCGVCHQSIDNLQKIRDGKSSEDLAIFVIAQDYQDPVEVREFLAKHTLNIPVLLGTDQTLSDYKISAFPTYYILDREGRIQSQSVGYSTELGIRLRLL